MVMCNVGLEVPEGCHLSDHTIGLRSVEDREVYNILMAHRKLICQPHTRKKYFFLGKKFPLLKDMVSVDRGGGCTERHQQEAVSGSESEIDPEQESGNRKKEKWDILSANSAG